MSSLCLVDLSRTLTVGGGAQPQEFAKGYFKMHFNIIDS